MNVFSDVEYELLYDTDCDNNGICFKNFDEAKYQCGHDSGCGGINDWGCNGGTYCLCMNGTNYNYWDDCVHNKVAKKV